MGDLLSSQDKDLMLVDDQFVLNDNNLMLDDLLNVVDQLDDLLRLDN